MNPIVADRVGVASSSHLPATGCSFPRLSEGVKKKRRGTSGNSPLRLEAIARKGGGQYAGPIVRRIGTSRRVAVAVLTRPSRPCDGLSQWIRFWPATVFDDLDGIVVSMTPSSM